MATLDDVAARAGVSKSTVSRAFSRPEAVGADTRRDILAIAREMGYTPNRTARSLRVGRTGNIGLFVPDIANPLFPRLIKAVQEEARRADLATFIADGGERAEDEYHIVHAMAQQVDGLIVVVPRMPDEQILRLREVVPVVLVNRQVDGVPAVLHSARQGMTHVAEHLAGLGHRTVAYLAGTDTFAGRDRTTSFLAAARKLKLRVNRLGPFEAQFEAGVRAADLVLATDATAVVAHADVIALGLMQHLLRRGVDIGRDVSVVGFDDIWWAALAHPPLTTVRVPVEADGLSAVRLLLTLMAGTTNGTDGVVRMPSELIVRGTTGPAPTRGTAAR